MESRRVEFFLCLGYVIIGTVTGLASDLLYYLELEESGKQEFVDTHNHFRRLVSSPEAANMRLMTWDEELAKVAQNHVRKCSFAHSSPSELKTVHFSAAGENVYAGSEFYYNELMTTAGVTKKWYDEVQHFNYNDLSCKQGEICGHYTQLVWAQSYKVGCYMARCRKIEGGNGEDLVTCAYGPGGNRYASGKPLSPYVSGEACGACGDGDLCVDQLCNNTERDIPFTTTTTVPDVTTVISPSAAPELTTTQSTTTTSSTTAQEVTTTDSATTESSIIAKPGVTTPDSTTASSATAAPELTTLHSTITTSSTIAAQGVTTVESATASSTIAAQEVTTADSTTTASSTIADQEVTAADSATTASSTTATDLDGTTTTTTTPYSNTTAVDSPTANPTTATALPWLTNGQKRKVIWGSVGTAALLLLFAWSKYGM